MQNLFFRLRLWNGSINQVNVESRSVNSIQFDTYDVRLDVKALMKGNQERSKHRMEMGLAEMWDFIKNSPKKDQAYYKALMDFHKKFSVPMASIVLGLLAVPLGFQASVRKRSSGLVMGLSFFLIYYVLLTAGWGFGKTGQYPPSIGMWMPNVIMGAVVVIFMYRSGRDRPLLFGLSFEFFEFFFSKLFSRKRS